MKEKKRTGIGAAIKTENGKSAFRQEGLTCHLCGRKIDFAESSWQEDDDLAIYCRHCWAERESCGCSD